MSSLRDYRVRVIPQGQSAVVERRVSAGSIAAARAMASEQGAVLGVVEDSSTRQKPGAPAWDVLWWCHEMQTLLRAGMTVVEAVETMGAETRGSSSPDVHSALLTGLQRGLTLSAAMAQSKAFPALLIAGVKASERTSEVAGALQEFVAYEQSLRDLAQQARSALIYPLIVMTVGVGIALFLLIGVMPRFGDLYQGLGDRIGWGTKLLLLSSGVLRDWGWLVFVLGALLALYIRARSGKLDARSVIAWVALRVPALRWRRDEYLFAKLFHSMAVLIRGGFTVDDALSTCLQLRLDPSVDHRLQQGLDAVRRGQGAASALQAAELGDGVSHRMLLAGERSGQFAEVLQVVAERHTRRFHHAVQSASKWVEPLVLLAAALVVGGLVILMYLPIFEVAGTLTG
jgi:general secretion pathway protein F